MIRKHVFVKWIDAAAGDDDVSGNRAFCKYCGVYEDCASKVTCILRRSEDGEWTRESLKGKVYHVEGVGE